jgi:hypothetical protein
LLVQPELLHVPAQSYMLQPLELHEEPMSLAHVGPPPPPLEQAELSHVTPSQSYTLQPSEPQDWPWLEAQSPPPPPPEQSHLEFGSL